MTKVLAVSDMHGFLPEIEPCDLLLIAGDTFPVWDHEPEFQRHWARTVLKDWLDKIPAKKVVAICGNHDFIGEKQEHVLRELPWIYLKDDSCTVYGIKIYGSPWVTKLQGWAFCTDEDVMAAMMEAVPRDTNLLLLHPPPYHIRDGIKNTNYHVGSTAIANSLTYGEWPKLKAMVFGHIHEGFGHSHLMGYDFYNVAYLDENYDERKPNGVTEIVI